MAKISDETEVSLPLRNMISMIAGASLATWAYFGLVERLNKLETNYTMQTADVQMNTEFRIKWPRGEMGSLPADSEQSRTHGFLRRRRNWPGRRGQCHHGRQARHGL